MKTVVVFSAQLLPISETFILEQVRALRDWHAILVGRRFTPNGAALDGVDVQLLHSPGCIHRWTFRVCQALNLPYLPSLRRLRKIRASLIHVHFGTNAVDIWPLVRALKIPMLVTLHGYDINIRRDWWEAGHGGWLRRAYPRRLLRLAGQPNVHFIAVSKAVRERAGEFGIPLSKVSVSYIGVDLETFRPAALPILQRIKRILFVGRLVEKKGVPHLLRAFAQVRKHVVDAELVIVGDGPLHDELKRVALDLKAPVQFLGALTTEQVKRQMDEAQVLCLPSITAANGDSEGFGMVLLEAQACGLPVVTSALGGSTEGIIDGSTGFRFDGADEVILATRLTELLTRSDTLERMSFSARKFVNRNFDIHKLASELEIIYDEMSSTPTRGR